MMSETENLGILLLKAIEVWNKTVSETRVDNVKGNYLYCRHLDGRLQYYSLFLLAVSLHDHDIVI